VLGKIGRIRSRDLLYPCRKPDCVTLRSVVHPQIVADLPDHDLAGIEAHSDGEIQAALEAKLVRIAAEPLLKVQCCVTRALCMILVRDRGPEKRHDAVAGILVDRAFEPMDSLGEDREEAIHDLVPFFGVYLLSQIHRALHVGEEHRHLLAFAF
jgi:hypothetical protein